jgi:hypothetical protein
MKTPLMIALLALALIGVVDWWLTTKHQQSSSCGDAATVEEAYYGCAVEK